jgi:2-(3-amino-3-carboxypropyl)histidine synthase
MEEDRAETDLGIAVDVEERLEEEAAKKAPKKRFVGRRQATEAAAKNIPNGAVEESGAIQSWSDCLIDLIQIN